MGPEFLIEVRYSQIVSSFYILMLYSSGIPLFYIVGFVSFFTMYWIDKYLFVSFYKTPPRYGTELNEISRNLMQYALVGHFVLGFYMYSNSQIFTYDQSFGKLDNIRERLRVDLQSFVEENNMYNMNRLY